MSVLLSNDMNEAFINGGILTWARERRGVTREKLAATLKATAAQVKAWENEDSYPPFGTAEKIAEVLKIPFGYFFLPSNPPDDCPLPDLRTLPAAVDRRLTADAIDFINSVKRKQDWYRKYAKFFAISKLPFIGSFSKSAKPQQIADSISSVLEIAKLRSQAITWAAYLSSLVYSAEGLGIIVIRTGIVKSATRRRVELSNFRGFAISDHIAPLIFVNANDSVAARTFTLVHELAHLWIGQTGISNATGVDGDQTLPVERLCNAVAAAVLVPQDMFVSGWHSHRQLYNGIDRLAAQFRISSEVIVRRAYDLQLISWSEYQILLDQVKAKQRQPKKSKGGDPARNLVARNGQVLIDAVTREIRNNRLEYLDASRLLGVRVPVVVKMTSGTLTRNLHSGLMQVC